MGFSSTSGIAVEEHVPTAFPCNDRRACSRSVSCRPGEAILIGLCDRPPAAQGSRRAGRAAGEKRVRIKHSEEALRRLEKMTPEEQARFPQLASVDGLEFANGVIEAEIAGAQLLNRSTSFGPVDVLTQTSRSRPWHRLPRRRPIVARPRPKCPDRSRLRCGTTADLHRIADRRSRRIHRVRVPPR